MSTITLDMLLDAATTTLPDASPAEQGELVAALVRKFDAELTPATIAPKPARKAKPKAAKTVAMKVNWAGTPMKSAKDTTSGGQIKWLVANAGKTPAQAKAMSMVEASNLRAKLTGKIA